MCHMLDQCGSGEPYDLTTTRPQPETYQKPRLGIVTGLPGVRVRVQTFVPPKNPYPRHGLRVTCTVTHHIKLCQLINFSTSFPALVMTTMTQNGMRRVGVLHPSSNKVCFPFKSYIMYLLTHFSPCTGYWGVLPTKHHHHLQKTSLYVAHF
jgi:hypothetical protein